MGLPRSFAQLKTDILDKAKQIQTCDDYHKVSLASNYGQLIDAGLSSLIWSYQSGLIDDFTLTDIPVADLKVKGIYNSGTATLNNPAIPIYIMPYTTVEVFMFGSHRQDFYCLGGTLKMNILSDAQAEITAYNDAQISLGITANGIGCITLRDEAKLVGIINSAGVVTVEGRGDSQARLTANNKAHLNLYGWLHAVLKYKLTGAATVSMHQNHESSIVPF